MTRRKKDPHEHVEQEFDTLKRLVHNMLTGSKNLQSQNGAMPYYLREHPSTASYVRGPLASAEGFILERLDQAKEFCSDMAKFDPDEQALVDLVEEKKITPDILAAQLTLLEAASRDPAIGAAFRTLAAQFGVSFPDAAPEPQEAKPVRMWMSGSPEVVLEGSFSNGPWPDRARAEARMNVGEVLVCKSSERLLAPGKGALLDDLRWLGDPVVTEAYVLLENGTLEALDATNLEAEVRMRLVRDSDPDMSP